MNRILSELRLYICNNIISHFPSVTVRMFFYRKVMGFKIGKGSYIFLNCRFDSTQRLTMGYSSVINAGCRIDTRGNVVIGNNVSISEDVILLTADHDMDTPDFAGRNRNIRIDDFAWIGTRAIIMPDIVVGEGAVVAAGSLVSKNVLSYSVVGGVPAKHIKERKRQQFTYSTSYKRLFH